MKKYSLMLLLIIAFAIFAEKVTISSPAGNISMEIEGTSSSQGSFESNVVVNNIMKRLNQLDKNYITKLNTKDRVEAKQLIDEIKYLVNSIPDNINITFSQNQVQVEETPVLEVNTKIGASEFQILLSDLEDASFEDDKIIIIKIAAQKHYFDVAQGKQIMEVFTFADDKLSVLKIIYPKIIDTDNSFQLINSFEFGEDKKKAERIIQSR